MRQFIVLSPDKMYVLRPLLTLQLIEIHLNIQVTETSVGAEDVFHVTLKVNKQTVTFTPGSTQNTKFVSFRLLEKRNYSIRRPQRSHLSLSFKYMQERDC